MYKGWAVVAMVRYWVRAILHTSLMWFHDHRLNPSLWSQPRLCIYLFFHYAIEGTPLTNKKRNYNITQ